MVRFRREVFIGHELPQSAAHRSAAALRRREALLSKMLNEGELHAPCCPGTTLCRFFGGGETPKMMAAYPDVKAALDDNQEIIDYVKRPALTQSCTSIDPPRWSAEVTPTFPRN